jgi:hypothetical protein
MRSPKKRVFLADYRDLWFPEFVMQRFAFAIWLTGTLNRRMLRRAAAAVTVSEGLAGYLRKVVRCPVWVCYNGFLESAYKNAERPWKDSRAHLVYTGNFYPDIRDPKPLFAAMALLFGERPELRNTLRLDIYGPPEDWVRAQIREFGLDDVVIDHGIVTYVESLRAQSCADALLFVDWMDPAAKGILTGKLFEYLATARPIINICRIVNSEASQLIRDARAGPPLADMATICKALEALAQRKLHVSVDEVLVAQFSRRAQANMLLDRIERLVTSRSSVESQCTGLVPS